MNIFSPGTLREIAKYAIDVSKLTVTAAFITPCFSAKEISDDIIIIMASVGTASFILGVILHRIVDHQEGKD